MSSSKDDVVGLPIEHHSSSAPDAKADPSGALLAALQSGTFGGPNGPANAAAQQRFMHDFNSWIIGGGYSRKTKGGVSERPKVGVQGDDDKKMDKRFIKMMNSRKEEIIAQKAKPIKLYKPLPVSRGKRGEGTGESDNEATKKERRPISPRFNVSKQEQKADPEGKVLRMRLQASFAQTSQNQSYGTLFPPLLTPYERPMHFLRGPDDRPLTPKKKRDVTDLGIVNKDRRKAEPMRTQPATGPKAFQPTGTNGTVFRHFAAYNQGSRAATAEMIAKQERKHEQLETLLQERDNRRAAVNGSSRGSPNSTMRNTAAQEKELAKLLQNQKAIMS